MNYYLIAGERSGDLHGASLIKGITKHDPGAQLRGWGGDGMEAAGMQLVRHYKDTAFMGFLEVARNVLTIQRYLKQCKEDLLAYKPDVLILIDYAGFNLRIAEFAKKHGIRVVYYISPKVWAWNEKRAWKIRRIVDRMFVIFPFEVDFYRRFNFEVEYVGNPLMDAIAAFQPDPAFKTKHQLSDKPILAILPGSRQQELDRMLKTMVSVRAHFPGYQFIIAGVSNLDRKLYEAFSDDPDVKIIIDAAYDILTVSEAALVVSGTATLETALLNVPQVVCYRTSSFSYWIARQLIKVSYISLVNLIADKPVVRELIQQDFTTDELAIELGKILKGGAERARILSDYSELRERVGGPGASEKTGTRIVEWLRNQESLKIKHVC